VGAPIPYEELAAFHIGADHEPFSAVSERDHAAAFRGVADLVTSRIEPLLDPDYQRAKSPEDDYDEGRGSDRFV
jgi:hypothetical protein